MGDIIWLKFSKINEVERNINFMMSSIQILLGQLKFYSRARIRTRLERNWRSFIKYANITNVKVIFFSATWDSKWYLPTAFYSEVFSETSKMNFIQYFGDAEAVMYRWQDILNEEHLHNFEHSLLGLGSECGILLKSSKIVLFK